MSTRQRGVDYSTAVVAALVSEFTDLADSITASVVREAVSRHADQPGPVFECIIDDPVLGNWRLRPHPAVASRVRLACFRLNPT
jgi:hypothetical protein